MSFQKLKRQQDHVAPASSPTLSYKAPPLPEQAPLSITQTFLPATHLLRSQHSRLAKPQAINAGVILIPSSHIALVITRPLCRVIVFGNKQPARRNIVEHTVVNQSIMGRIAVSWSLVFLAMGVFGYVSVEATGRSLRDKANKLEKGNKNWKPSSYGEMTAGGFGGGSYSREELDKGLQSWRGKDTTFEELTAGGYGGGSGYNSGDYGGGGGRGKGGDGPGGYGGGGGGYGNGGGFGNGGGSGGFGSGGGSGGFGNGGGSGGGNGSGGFGNVGGGFGNGGGYGNGVGPGGGGGFGIGSGGNGHVGGAGVGSDSGYPGMGHSGGIGSGGVVGGAGGVVGGAGGGGGGGRGGGMGYAQGKN